MIIIIIYKTQASRFLDMENSLVHIAIKPNTLAALIQSGQIHAVDFKCLNVDSKRIVWKLFLSVLKATVTK
jgi:hypothetical protein